MNCCHASPAITFYPYLTGSFIISVITLLIVVFSIKIFRLNNPAIKYRLMFLPLMAPVLAYLTYPPLIFRKYLALSSPYLLISKPMRFAEDPLASTIALLVWLGVGWAVLSGLISLLAAWRLRRKHSEITINDEPRLFEILSRLLQKTNLRRIAVIYLPKKTPSAFAFGIFKPTLVVSKGLLEKLNLRELEAVLAHEIAHMVRRDSLTIWLAKILRDVMFYNPFSYLIYSFLVREKEKASDEWGIAVTKKPLVFAQSIFKVWKLVLRFNSASRIRAATPYLVPKASLLEERVEMALNCTGNGYPRKAKYLTGLVVFIVGLAWVLLVNFGVLAPAKTGRYLYLNKPIVSGGKHISGKVYLHFPGNAQHEVNLVSVCSNSSCHGSRGSSGSGM